MPAECVLPGAGSSSLLFTCLPRLLRDGASALILAPMYSEYEHIVGTLLGGVVRYHTLRPEDGFAVNGDELLREVQRIRPDAVLLVNPNNPTGRLWPRAEIIRFLDQLPAGALVVIDEAYLDYVGAAESLEQEAAIREDLVIVKSMSKVYALSGARVAYLVTNASLAARLRPWLPPWPVGLLSQAAAMEALRDPGYYAARYAETHRLREQLIAGVSRLRPRFSQVNNFLVEPDNPARLAAAFIADPSPACSVRTRIHRSPSKSACPLLARSMNCQGRFSRSVCWLSILPTGVNPPCSVFSVASSKKPARRGSEPSSSRESLCSSASTAGLGSSPWGRQCPTERRGLCRWRCTSTLWRRTYGRSGGATAAGPL